MMHKTKHSLFKMRIHYDSHGKVKRRHQPASLFVEQSLHDLPFDAKTREKIVREYFKVVREAILQGFMWHFPDGTKMWVCWERRANAHGVSRYKRGTDGYRIFTYNSRRINQHYSICMEGPLLEKSRYRLQTNDKLRAELVKILFHTDRQYRLKK